MALVASALLGARGASTWFGAACVVVQLVAIAVDRATRKLRRDLGGNVDMLGPEDPRRRRFGALHGIAMLLLLLQIVAAGAGIVLQ